VTVYESNFNLGDLRQPPGVACPLCGHGLMDFGHDSQARPALSCACCRGFVRLVQRHRDTTPLFDLADAEDAALLPVAGGW
jgi:hypothetical protein